CFVSGRGIVYRRKNHVRNLWRCYLFRHRLLIPILCFLIVPPLLAQGMTYGGTGSMTRDDQMALVAPTSSGETGLFTVITADTLRRGDWSFGIYFNNWDLEAGREPSSLTIPSARKDH